MMSEGCWPSPRTNTFGNVAFLLTALWQPFFTQEKQDKLEYETVRKLYEGGLAFHKSSALRTLARIGKRDMQPWRETSPLRVQRQDSARARFTFFDRVGHLWLGRRLWFQRLQGPLFSIPCFLNIGSRTSNIYTLTCNRPHPYSRRHRSTLYWVGGLNLPEGLAWGNKSH